MSAKAQAFADTILIRHLDKFLQWDLPYASRAAGARDLAAGVKLLRSMDGAVGSALFGAFETMANACVLFAEPCPFEPEDMQRFDAWCRERIEMAGTLDEIHGRTDASAEVTAMHRSRLDGLIRVGLSGLSTDLDRMAQKVVDKLRSERKTLSRLNARTLSELPPESTPMQALNASASHAKQRAALFSLVEGAHKPTDLLDKVLSLTESRQLEPDFDEHLQRTKAQATLARFLAFMVTMTAERERFAILVKGVARGASVDAKRLVGLAARAEHVEGAIDRFMTRSPGDDDPPLNVKFAVMGRLNPLIHDLEVDLRREAALLRDQAFVSTFDRAAVDLVGRMVEAFGDIRTGLEDVLLGSSEYAAVMDASDHAQYERLASKVFTAFVDDPEDAMELPEPEPPSTVPASPAQTGGPAVEAGADTAWMDAPRAVPPVVASTAGSKSSRRRARKRQAADAGPSTAAAPARVAGPSRADLALQALQEVRDRPSAYDAALGFARSRIARARADAGDRSEHPVSVHTLTRVMNQAADSVERGIADVQKHRDDLHAALRGAGKAVSDGGTLDTTLATQAATLQRRLGEIREDTQRLRFAHAITVFVAYPDHAGWQSIAKAAAEDPTRLRLAVTRVHDRRQLADRPGREDPDYLDAFRIHIGTRDDDTQPWEVRTVPESHFHYDTTDPDEPPRWGSFKSEVEAPAKGLTRAGRHIPRRELVAIRADMERRAGASTAF